MNGVLKKIDRLPDRPIEYHTLMLSISKYPFGLYAQVIVLGATDEQKNHIIDIARKIARATNDEFEKICTLPPKYWAPVSWIGRIWDSAKVVFRIPEGCDEQKAREIFERRALEFFNEVLDYYNHEILPEILAKEF